jgi:N-acetylglucosamine-6-phosphate deacetylase
VPLVEAVRAASVAPARVLGLSDHGAIEPGMVADLVVAGPGMVPQRVMRAGRWLSGG